MFRFIVSSSLLAVLSFFVSHVHSADISVLTKENWKELAPHGKEVDAIYGDFVLRNDIITVVVSQAKPGRKANMTVRDVSGSILDLTHVKGSNDQLSCFYPLNRRFDFSKTAPKQSTLEIGGTSVSSLKFVSAKTDQETQATLEYQIADGQPYVSVTTTISNLSDTDKKSVMTQDSIRADKLFKYGLENKNFYWADDEWFRQGYGVLVEDVEMDLVGRGSTTIDYIVDGKKAVELGPGESTSVSRKVFPGRSQLNVQSIANRLQKVKQQPVALSVSDAAGPVGHAKVEISKDGKFYGNSRTSLAGKSWFGLPDGKYTIKVTALGRPVESISVDIKRGSKKQTKRELEVKLEQCGYVESIITGKDGKAIPCKVGFYGIDGTADPNFGPTSEAVAVGNLHYSHNGTFRQAIGPGKYEALISYGPEYDAVTKTIEVKRGETTSLTATINKTVDTTGWVSTEYHSHSSPSGDNVSDQFGRVLNLLCENLEFCPCTEHNRISSYMPHLRRLKVESLMATCSGMELTGSPLPVNHQNAFPLHRHVHEQDGGGPQTDTNPVVQIERLAMWDDASDKLVQGNHPNIRQIYGDRDLDKKADGGFRKMFGFMDVIEVHPPELIFETPEVAAKRGGRGNTIFQWMQLLNHGYRITGVVNTDAHYNFHGSGAVRNYVQSSTDDPAKIKVMEMVHESEHGHVIMTNGPFMQVNYTSGKATGTAGDEVKSRDGKGSLKIKIQCSNWLDVNRVQIFLNGRMAENLNFTRRTHADKFGNNVVKFESNIELELKEDTHVIVAAIGEDLQLGRVMGPTYGKRVPCVVSNPIFIDFNGDGFKPNQDDLGLPLLEETN
ncbi:MAG: hypothetical protein COA78_01580 [Blastopirellula sp.]|nr:MAG: hypothetical protein COA78_01580 [Blastopirellula sp.]